MRADHNTIIKTGYYCGPASQQCALDGNPAQIRQPRRRQRRGRRASGPGWANAVVELVGLVELVSGGKV